MREGTPKREAYVLDYAQTIREVCDCPLMECLAFPEISRLCIRLPLLATDRSHAQVSAAVDEDGFSGGQVAPDDQAQADVGYGFR